MQHELIAKYDALMQMANIHRNMQHDKSVARHMTHNHFLVDKVYGISFDVPSVLTMYCYARATEDSKSTYIRLPLREFTKDDQAYQLEVQGSYIALCRELEALKEPVRDEFIGKTVIRIGIGDEGSVDEEVVINEVNFDLELCFAIKGCTLTHVLSHRYFK